MVTKILAGMLLLAAIPCFGEDLPGEPYDFNFDGHMDYRVLLHFQSEARQARQGRDLVRADLSVPRCENEAGEFDLHLWACRGGFQRNGLHLEREQI